MRTSPSCLACPREVRSGPLVRVSEEVVNNAIRPGGSRRLSDMYGGADTNGGGGRTTTTARLPRDYAKTQSVIVRWMADRKQLNQTGFGCTGVAETPVWFNLRRRGSSRPCSLHKRAHPSGAPERPGHLPVFPSGSRGGNVQQRTSVGKIGINYRF